VLAILDEISRAIVNELRLTLHRGQRRYDLDLQTYDLYLRGRALVARRSIPGSLGAVELFEKVLKRDPAFAPAYAGLANAYAFLALPRSYPFKTAHSMMRSAAVKAIELDPLLAEAHAAMGWVYSYDFDWENAQKSFERAIELDPGLTQTSTSYAIAALEPLGKLDEALRILRAALRHDPLSLDVQREIGQVQLLAGRYEEALDTFHRVRAIDPDFPFVDDFIARALMYAGRLSEAIPLLEKHDSRYVGAPGRIRRNPWLARAYVMTGRRAEAETLVQEHEGDDSRVAIIYAALGDKDRAFEALERAALVEPHRVPRTLMIYPEMAVLRGDPRLVALRQRFRLPPQ
jgi:tetratricopeptide (TPR) repeat protein